MKVVRYLLVAALLVSAAAVMVFGRRSAPPVGDGFTRIQYWEKWTGDEERSMRTIVEDFNATVGKEKKIFVDYVSMSEIAQKTLCATAAGVPPDVAGLWDPQVSLCASMNSLVPLDDLAAEHGITPSIYKPIFWNGCKYHDKLYALVSTPEAIVLHYNKQLFLDRAAELKAAGFDPNIPPRDIAELDRMADVLTRYVPGSNNKRIEVAGYLPMEPGWYISLASLWFDGPLFDPKTQTLLIASKPVIDTFAWIASYSKKYGSDAISDFRSGLGGFASAQSPFLARAVVMVQQGPWMARMIEVYAPQLNRWHVPAEKLSRERNFAKLTDAMPRATVIELLGEPQKSDQNFCQWDAGIKTITISFSADQKIMSKQMDYLPAKVRQQYCEWGAAPFPSVDKNSPAVAYCGFDALAIPRGSKHPREAFEFIAYINRQDVMEKLCAMHCKNSPLANVSSHFIDYHPNPYIDVFETASKSPGAFGSPSLPVWPEMDAELNVAAQQCALLEQSPTEALDDVSARMTARWDYVRHVDELRDEKKSANYESAIH